MGRNPQGPSVAEIRRALEEARRSAMTPHERAALIRDLEAKLHRAAEEERRAQLVVEEDRRRFLAAADRLVALLRRYLPPPKGEGAYPHLPQQILGGEDPALRLEAVPEKATVLTLRLMPVRLRLGGVDLVVGEAGDEYTLSLEGADYPLVEGDPLVVPFGQWEVWAFRRGRYAHVRLEVREGAHLSQLLVEGRILAHLVHPVKEYAYLRLMRAFSARLKGPVDYRAFGSELAQKFSEVPLDTLEEFARKGLKVVRQRLERAPAGLRYLGEVGEALGLVQEAKHLQSLLADWLNYRPPTRETIGGEIGTVTLTAEPVSIDAGKVVLSVRQVEDAVYVTVAGQVPRRLRDLLVWAFADQAVVIAREGHRIAHVVLPIEGA
ncbi:hypothetical protein [Marinithermus hydrothermalis]|uniref:hypothetical protein n=1 Tax=Marinithermus hydrothermalis TaxID=186192 RepID=UPI000690E69C|nr:hypothetical protein [Marinithermus hydrothermalis]